jgi:hypothetical protein
MVGVVWILYACALACYGRYAWANLRIVAVAAALLIAFVGIYLLQVVRSKSQR